MAEKSGAKADNRTLVQKLWDAADALRGNQEPSEYKHVVLGLVFLKYISDRFDERRAAIVGELTAVGIPADRHGEFIEDRDEYASHNVFWVPTDARWEVIQASAKQTEVGETIDRAMDLIEKENTKIRGVLPRNYAREGLDKGRLGQLVDLIGSIGFGESDDHGSDDVLGRVYEYFLGQFAGKETGKDAGAFYTPRSVVTTLVEMWSRSAAADLHDLRIPPGNRLEQLVGDRRGQHSIRVNAQWRICFVWRDGGAEHVELVDYH